MGPRHPRKHTQLSRLSFKRRILIANTFRQDKPRKSDLTTLDYISTRTPTARRKQNRTLHKQLGTKPKEKNQTTEKTQITEKQ